MDEQTLNIRPVNDKKITDHHAILITENKPNELQNEEQTIYEMIAGRLLEAFSGKCVKESTTVVFSCADTLFETKGAIVKQAGWRAVWGEKEETDEDGNLPELLQGDTLPILQSELLEKQTKPKPLHTEASLLSAMESAGKEVENEADREAMKESGIGTPATRAAIIETLFARDYIRREPMRSREQSSSLELSRRVEGKRIQKKSLIPTGKGLSVYDVVKDMRIADVALTGSWENLLAQIERGETHPDTFRQAIDIYTRQITAELLGTKIELAGSNVIICPKCKTAQTLFYPKVVKCPDEQCGLVVFRSVSGKQLTDKHVADLLATGKTPIIKGFKSKGGKSFDAGLKFDESYKVVFDFPERKRET